MKIKVSIAEDHHLMRESLISMLHSHSNVKVLSGADNGFELLGQLKLYEPEIVLLDIDMPVMGGKETLLNIKKLYPKIKVIMLSFHYEKSYIVEYIYMGAAAYLSKACRWKELIKTINEVHQHGYYYDNSVKEMLQSENDYFELKDSKGNKTLLNGREIKIIEFLMANLTNKEIASALCISARTLEGIRSNIMQKTGSKNLAALLKFAISNKLISII